MKKLDLLKLIGTSALAAGAMVDPRIGLVEKGVASLIHRDSDPTHDLDETADAVTAIVLNAISEAEDLTGHDVVNNAVLVTLAATIKSDIKLYLQLAKQLKPAA